LHTRAGGKSGPPVVGAPLSLPLVVVVVVVVVVLSSVLVALVVAGSPLLAVVSPDAGMHPITSAAAAAATAVRALEVHGMAKLVGRLRMVPGSLARACLSPLVRPRDDHPLTQTQAGAGVLAA